MKSLTVKTCSFILLTVLVQISAVPVQQPREVNLETSQQVQNGAGQLAKSSSDSVANDVSGTQAAVQDQVGRASGPVDQNGNPQQGRRRRGQRRRRPKGGMGGAAGAATDKVLDVSGIQGQQNGNGQQGQGGNGGQQDQGGNQGDNNNQPNNNGGNNGGPNSNNDDGSAPGSGPGNEGDQGPEGGEVGDEPEGGGAKEDEGAGAGGKDDAPANDEEEEPEEESAAKKKKSKPKEENKKEKEKKGPLGLAGGPLESLDPMSTFGGLGELAGGKKKNAGAKTKFSKKGSSGSRSFPALEPSFLFG